MGADEDGKWHLDKVDDGSLSTLLYEIIFAHTVIGNIYQQIYSHVSTLSLHCH